METKDELMSFKLRDKSLIKKCRAYCQATKMQNIELAEIAFRQFFENEKN